MASVVHDRTVDGFNDERLFNTVQKQAEHRHHLNCDGRQRLWLVPHLCCGGTREMVGQPERVRLFVGHRSVHDAAEV